ncbi:hypothetical protein TUBRATIS_006370 [Tubulinosema ratisbonensis]|uniref:Uncharacterized protein n=1 Tax=Tubulinosema ratisbonensis TaxID=291195 RepID=A0A437AP50_9MICR|nr:hypothetical protein TUBRATIS_006370 [Tubulinosema ratisbonensis]
MEIIFVKNRKEEIFFILTQFDLSNPALIITNTLPMFTGFESLKKYKNTLFIEILEVFSLEKVIKESQFYNYIFICNFQLNNFQLAFLKKYFQKKNKKIIFFVKTEEENKILSFQEILKEFIF